MTGIVVASFNVHAGVDGWGRPFDVVGACQAIDADVLVLQEAWAPADGGPSTAELVADALGYQVRSVPMARCVMLPPPAAPPPVGSWGPRPGAPERRQHGPRVLPGVAGEGRGGAAVRDGSWCLAVLWRLPTLRTEVIDLGRLPTDGARRAAVVVEVDPAAAGGPARVVGTHMSHLTQGSPLQLRRLARALSAGGRAATDATVLTGDMNLWGPPVVAAFPGMRRVVRGRTWPAWRPLAQIDHVLAGAALARDASGEVLPPAGSDHRPVRARVCPRS